MRKFGFVLALFALVMALAAPAFAQADSVCLITNEAGRINDGTFNTFAYNGMIRAAEDFGLENTYIETLSAADYAANFEACINEGYDIIVTVGFLITDATLAAAQQYPDVMFIGVDQFHGAALPNLVGLQFREDQGGFLAGAMAALMTESGTIAGVYGIPIPPVVKFRNGFEQGARYVNPDVNVLGVYIDDFNAPDRGAAAAEQFLGEDADVILGAGGPTGSGAITFAAAQGAFVIGVDQDEYFTTFGSGETPGADRLITSAIKRVDNGVYDMIEAAAGGMGFPASSLYILEVANDGIGFAPANEAPVPQEVSDEVTAIQQGLRDGSIVTGANPVTGELLPTIAEVVVASTTAETPEFTTLLAAVMATGWDTDLAEGGPFTVFAPTDAAFAAALEALGMTAEDLLADPELLTNILLYHVVPGAMTSSMIGAGMPGTLPTLNGAELTLTYGDMLMVDGANVVMTDVLARNGVIHVIDAVLLPPME
jgi:basic membrane lipoprotein Med (substrate-binding protein (PBP1-ABC) superfamily)